MKTTSSNIVITLIFLLIVKSELIGQSLSVGEFHTQYICNDSTVMSWGYDCDGRLGRTGQQNLPGNVSIPENVKKVSAGSYHSLYLTATGNVYASGKNLYGQLGIGSNTNNFYVPQLINNLDSIVDISAGTSHSLFLRYDGTVYSCGRNDSYQLGDSTNIHKYTPVQILHIDSVIKISAGFDNSLFLRIDGKAYGCGSGGGGKLGIGPFYSSLNTKVPVEIDTLSNVIDLSAGENHSLFITSDNRVYACGENNAGQLGLGTTTSYYHYPEFISSVDSCTQAIAHDEVSVFLRENGTVFVCGRFMNGYTGGSNFNNINVPAQIPNLSNITEIGVGSTYFFIFEFADTTLLALGDNYSGYLGIGSNVSTMTPVNVQGLCGSQITLDIDNNISELNNQIYVYPNPFNDVIEIKSIDIELLFKIYNMMGELVFIGKITQTHQKFDFSNLKNGIYYLHIDSYYPQIFKLIKT